MTPTIMKIFMLKNMVDGEHKGQEIIIVAQITKTGQEEEVPLEMECGTVPSMGADLVEDVEAVQMLDQEEVTTEVHLTWEEGEF